MPSRKQPVDEVILDRSPKHRRTGDNGSTTTPVHIVQYPDHPDSGVGENFHSVPYPLSLLPLKSWSALHNHAEAGAVCAKCHRTRRLSVHQRKLFLVAERLSWSKDAVSRREREQNEESTWAVNAELGILEPVVFDEEMVVGGRMSRENELYPYRSLDEVVAALKLVATAVILTERSFQVWLELLLVRPRHCTDGDAELLSQDGLMSSRDVLRHINASSRTVAAPSNRERTIIRPEGSHAVDSRETVLPSPPSSAQRDSLIDAYPESDRFKKFSGQVPECCTDDVKAHPNWALTENKDPFHARQTGSRHSFSAIPPSSTPSQPTMPETSRDGHPNASFKSLLDFYSLLDKLEWRSPVGDAFLVAYAKNLRSETCSECWFQHDVLSDDDLRDQEKLFAHPTWRSAGQQNEPWYRPC